MKSHLMGFWDFLKGEKSEDELIAEKCNEIIEKMEIPQLRDMCKNLIGSFPRNKLVLTDKDGKEKQFVDPISRNDYENFIDIFYNKGEINLEQIKNYLVKHKFASPYDFVFKSEKNDGKEELKKGDSINLDSIIRRLENEFKPEKLQSEDHLQAQIFQFLKAKFPNADVRREQPLKNIRDSIDILVNGKYAIEVKVPADRTALRNLAAQLEEYQEEYPDICVVILDNEELNLSEDINYYKERYKSKLGVDSVVLSGRKRG